jgi:hypothetical protein
MSEIEYDVKYWEILDEFYAAEKQRGRSDGRCAVCGGSIQSGECIECGREIPTAQN